MVPTVPKTLMVSTEGHGTKHNLKLMRQKFTITPLFTERILTLHHSGQVLAQKWTGKTVKLLLPHITPEEAIAKERVDTAITAIIIITNTEGIGRTGIVPDTTDIDDKSLRILEI